MKSDEEKTTSIAGANRCGKQVAARNHWLPGFDYIFLCRSTPPLSSSFCPAPIVREANWNTLANFVSSLDSLGGSKTLTFFSFLTWYRAGEAERMEVVWLPCDRVRRAAQPQASSFCEGEGDGGPKAA